MPPDYQKLLTDFASAVGFPEVDHLLKHEMLRLKDVPLRFSLDENDGRRDVVCFSVLGSPPDESLAETTRLLLEANYLWAGTEGGATLGMNANDNSVVIAERFPLEFLNGQLLATLLGPFVDQALVWRSYLQGGNLPAKPVEDPSAVEGGSGTVGDMFRRKS